MPWTKKEGTERTRGGPPSFWSWPANNWAWRPPSNVKKWLCPGPPVVDGTTKSNLNEKVVRSTIRPLMSPSGVYWASNPNQLRGPPIPGSEFIGQRLEIPGRNTYDRKEKTSAMKPGTATQIYTSLCITRMRKQLLRRLTKKNHRPQWRLVTLTAEKF